MLGGCPNHALYIIGTNTNHKSNLQFKIKNIDTFYCMDPHKSQKYKSFYDHQKDNFQSFQNKKLVTIEISNLDPSICLVLNTLNFLHF